MKLNDILKRHGVGVGSSKEIPDDLTSSPGPKMLIAGDMSAGFFGEVSAAEIGTSSEVSMAAAHNSWTIINEETKWLKFAYEGKVLFYPMKSLKYTSVDNQREYLVPKKRENVIIKNHKYHIYRGIGMMRPNFSLAAGRMPSDSDFKNSQWEKIFLPITSASSSGDWGFPNQLNGDIPNWAYYTKEHLGIGITNVLGGSPKGLEEARLSQYTMGSSYAGQRFGNTKGEEKIDYRWWYSGNTSPKPSYGWRPLLEYVEEA